MIHGDNWDEKWVVLNEAPGYVLSERGEVRTRMSNTPRPALQGEDGRSFVRLISDGQVIELDLMALVVEYFG